MKKITPLYLISKLFTLCALIVITSACQRYSVSLNDRTVYTPPVLFADYNITDDALMKCVKATIEEQKITSAKQLKRLVCGPGNIASLEGLQDFSKLITFGAQDNKIIDISVFEAFTQLEKIDVSNNDIKDFTSLSELPSLQTLKAKGNTHAQCQTLTNFPPAVILEIPTHCQ